MHASRKPLSLTTLRLIWAAYALTIPILVEVGSHATGTPESRPGWGTGLLTASLLWSVWSLYRFRTKLMKRAAQRAVDGDSVGGARSWATGHFVRIASAESIVCWGLLAHVILHSPAWVSMTFYCAGGTLLLLYWPRAHEAAFDSQS